MLLRVIQAALRVDVPCHFARERLHAAHKMHDGRIVPVMGHIRHLAAVQRARIAGLTAAGGIKSRVGKHDPPKILFFGNSFAGNHLRGEIRLFRMGVIECRHMS